MTLMIKIRIDWKGDTCEDEKINAFVNSFINLIGFSNI